MNTWSLVWVLIDGRARHVSTFAGMPPRERPDARCPECGAVVTLKLGRTRRHHAAHAAHAVCAAAHPETALHLDCKLALAAALIRALAAARATDPAASGPALSMIRACAGPLIGPSESCNATAVAPLAERWDAVDVEHQMASDLRPDVVLLHRGVAVAAIEIAVTHAVSPEKASALNARGIPWIEINGVEALTSIDGWRFDEPLHGRAEGGRPPWRCAEHRATLLAARVVDVYHPGGSRERFIYKISASDGDERVLRLRCGTRVLATVALEDRVAARAAMRLAFEDELRRLAAGDGAFTDSPMRWASADAAENIVDGALLDRVGRDPTPLATTFPRRWFYAAESGQWFLPREMRDVRWDRPAADAFAAHPAWRASALRVRERAVPAAAWGEPFLASRPVAAMFGYEWPSHSIAEGIRRIDVERDGALVRSIVVVEQAVDDERLAAAIRHVESERPDAVWLLHPRDWSPLLAPCVWVVSGRDARARGAVFVDGVGVLPPARFARALSKGDRRFTGVAIRRAMSARTDRLMAACKR